VPVSVTSRFAGGCLCLAAFASEVWAKQIAIAQGGDPGP
jgi:hypothetical protein